MIHHREFASPFWLTAPASLDHIPNRVLQPLVLTWVRWAGWPHTIADVLVHTIAVVAVIWQYPRENLIVTGRFYQVVGWITTGGLTEKEVIARE